MAKILMMITAMYMRPFAIDKDEKRHIFWSVSLGVDRSASSHTMGAAISWLPFIGDLPL